MSRVSVIGSICQLKKSITQRKASIAVQILKWPFLLFFAPYFISKKIQKKKAYQKKLYYRPKDQRILSKMGPHLKSWCGLMLTMSFSRSLSRGIWTV